MVVLTTFLLVWGLLGHTIAEPLFLGLEVTVVSTIALEIMFGVVSRGSHFFSSWLAIADVIVFFLCLGTLIFDIAIADNEREENLAQVFRVIRDVLTVVRLLFFLEHVSLIIIKREDRHESNVSVSPFLASNDAKVASKPIAMSNPSKSADLLSPNARGLVVSSSASDVEDWPVHS